MSKSQASRNVGTAVWKSERWPSGPIPVASGRNVRDVFDKPKKCESIDDWQHNSNKSHIQLFTTVFNTLFIYLFCSKSNGWTIGNTHTLACPPLFPSVSVSCFLHACPSLFVCRPALKGRPSVRSFLFSLEEWSPKCRTDGWTPGHRRTQNRAVYYWDGATRATKSLTLFMIPSFMLNCKTDSHFSKALHQCSLFFHPILAGYANVSMVPFAHNLWPVGTLLFNVSGMNAHLCVNFGQS